MTIVPCSTVPQDDNRWAFRLRTTIDDRDGWAICDKLYTVAVSRLIPHKSTIKRIGQDEFDSMMDVILAWLPAGTNN